MEYKEEEKKAQQGGKSITECLNVFCVQWRRREGRRGKFVGEMWNK